MDMLRILSKPFSALEISVHIARNAREAATSRNQPYRQLDPISFYLLGSPLIESPVSFITVAQDNLGNWEEG